MGYGILDIGAQTRQQALTGLRDAANQDQQREAANENLKQQKKQGTMSAIGTGASMGFMIGGPVGGLVGAGIGLVGSMLF